MFVISKSQTPCSILNGINMLLVVLNSVGGWGGREHYSPTISLYDFSLKSARCCDEISKINIYSNKKYVSTRSNCFCTFHVFWPTSLVRNTNLKGLVYSLIFSHSPQKDWEPLQVSSLSLGIGSMSERSSILMVFKTFTI